MERALNDGTSETRDLLLATFTVARDPNDVPSVVGVYSLRRDSLSAWVEALGGLAPQEVVQEFVAADLLSISVERKWFVLRGMPDNHGERRIGRLTPKGRRFVHEYLRLLGEGTWLTQTRLGVSGVKAVLQWIAVAAIGGIIGNRADAGLVELIGRALGNAPAEAQALAVKMAAPRVLEEQATPPEPHMGPSSGPPAWLLDPLMMSIVFLSLLLARCIRRWRPS